MFVVFLVTLLLMGVGCGGSPPSSTDDAGVADVATCSPGQRGTPPTCTPVGPRRCPGGLRRGEGQPCVVLGPVKDCTLPWGPGLERADDGICEPVVASGPCPAGLLRQLGNANCVPLGNCGSGPWGGIAELPDDVHVDPNASPHNADGSRARPYTEVAVASTMTKAGGRLVLAAGGHLLAKGEALQIRHALTVIGACSAKVTLAAHDGLAIHVDTKAVRLQGLTILGALGASPSEFWPSVHVAAGARVEAEGVEFGLDGEVGTVRVDRGGELLAITSRFRSWPLTQALESAGDLHLLRCDVGAAMTVSGGKLRVEASTLAHPLLLAGGEATVEGSLLQRVHLSGATEVASLTLRASLVEAGDEVGLEVGPRGEAMLERSVLRGRKEALLLAGSVGQGAMARPTATVNDSYLATRPTSAGEAALLARHGDLEGAGLLLVGDSPALRVEGGEVALRDLALEGGGRVSHGGSLELREARVRAADGLGLLAISGGNERSQLTVINATVEDARGAAVVVASSGSTLDGLTVPGVRPGAGFGGDGFGGDGFGGDGFGGDGVIVGAASALGLSRSGQSSDEGGDVRVERSDVHSARVGLLLRASSSLAITSSRVVSCKLGILGWPGAELKIGNDVAFHDNDQDWAFTTKPPAP
jgi:hypothetical protein